MMTDSHRLTPCSGDVLWHAIRETWILIPVLHRRIGARRKSHRLLSDSLDWRLNAPDHHLTVVRYEHPRLLIRSAR